MGGRAAGARRPVRGARCWGRVPASGACGGVRVLRPFLWEGWASSGPWELRPNAIPPGPSSGVSENQPGGSCTPSTADRAQGAAADAPCTSTGRVPRTHFLPRREHRRHLRPPPCGPSAGPFARSPLGPPLVSRPAFSVFEAGRLRGGLVSRWGSRGWVPGEEFAPCRLRGVSPRPGLDAGPWGCSRRRSGRSRRAPRGGGTPRPEAGGPGPDALARLPWPAEVPGVCETWNTNVEFFLKRKKIKTEKCGSKRRGPHEGPEALDGSSGGQSTPRPPPSASLGRAPVLGRGLGRGQGLARPDRDVRGRVPRAHRPLSCACLQRTRAR